jgi:hypothetical protein
MNVDRARSRRKTAVAGANGNPILNRNNEKMALRF